MYNASFNIKRVRCSILKFGKQYCADERGSTAIEYGLIAALISVLLITGGSSLGGSINDKFADISLLLSGPAEIPTANSVAP